MLPGIVLCVVGMVLLGLPLLAIVGRTGEASAAVALHSAGDLVLPTLGWCAAVAVVSVVLGRLVAPALAASPRRVLVLVLTPALLPSAAVFYVWFALLPPDLPGAGRNALLLAALVSTGWPIAALLLTAVVGEVSTARRELLDQIGAGWLQRAALVLRIEWPMWIASGALVGAVALLATTTFDLAGVVTAATEVRARLALGAGLAAVAGPLAVLLVPCLAGAIGGWWATGRLMDNTDALPDASPRWAVVLFLASAGVPLLALSWIAGVPLTGTGDGLFGAVFEALLRSVCVGAVLAVLFVPMVAVCRRMRQASGLSWHVVVALWLLCALLPAAVIASGWSALQQVGPVWMGEWGVGRAAALLVAPSAAAWLIARGIAASEPRDRADLRRLEGAPWWRPCRATLHGMLATGAVGLAWSLFAPAIEARLAPPAHGPPLVTRLVDAMHYQRPESVLVAMWMIAGITLAVAVVVSVVVSMGVAQRRAAALCVAAIMLVGCSDAASDTAPQSGVARVPFTAIIGGPGTAPGRFVTPRAANAAHGELLVIDRSGRLQRISDAGTQVVELPLVGRGYPTGVVRAPDGTAFIADTHGGRILRVQVDGTVDVFAGTGVPESAQFVTPSDVALLDDGRVVVSVYGGDDHVAVLLGDGTLERTLGSSGEAVGAFRRPQALAVNAAGMVWVADACNHRLQLLDPDTGEVLQVLNAGGAMRYPYGLAVLPGGDLLVAEYGGHVLRRLAPDGSRTRVWGGWGDGPGQLRTPWSVSIDEDARVAYLVDSGHDRVLRIDLEALAW